MHRIKINIPVYDFKFTVLISDELKKDINRYLKKAKMELMDEDDEFYGAAFVTPKLEYFIFYDLQALTPSTIIHEISHITDFLLESRGMELVGEARAYITDHIAGKVFDYVLKNKILISKYLNYEQNPKQVSVPESGPKEVSAKD